MGLIYNERISIKTGELVPRAGEKRDFYTQLGKED